MVGVDVFTPRDDGQEAYRVFPSYTVDASFDSDLVSKFSKEMTTEKVNGKSVRIYGDYCRRFDDSDPREIVSFLCSAQLAVLVVSMSALREFEGLKNTSPVHALFLEWCLVLELYTLGSLEGSLPIFFGSISEQPSGSGAFSESLFANDTLARLLEGLPDVVCEPVVSLVEEALLERDMTPSSKLRKRTVKDVVTELTKFNGVLAWDCRALDADPTSGLGGTAAGFTRACVYEIVSEVISILSRPPSSTLPTIDVYPSYTWREPDMRLSRALTLELMTENVKGRATRIFNDVEDLQKGRNHIHDTVSFLCSAKVAVPFVSENSIRRLQAVELTAVTSLLLEWCLMLELAAQGSLQLCLPIFLGTILEQPSESGAFSESLFANDTLARLLEGLPDVVCEPVVSLVEEALLERDMTPSSKLRKRTVKDVVTELTKFNGVLAWDCRALDADPTSGLGGTAAGFTRAVVDSTVSTVMEVLVRRAEGAVGREHAEQSSSGGAADKFRGSLRQLCLGRAAIAARGLRAHVGLQDEGVFAGLVAEGVQGVVKEVEASGSAEDKANLAYILHGVACNTHSIPAHVRADMASGHYHGGAGFKAGDYDLGHAGWRFENFCQHRNSRSAGLVAAEVLALRLYTTSSFSSFNAPLRARLRPHPWRITVYHLDQGIRKLRAVEAANAPADFIACKTLWRGMRDMELADAQAFRDFGGTELAPMSTSASRAVAEGYATGSSQGSLLFRLDTRGMNRGCSLAYLSAYPKEKEFLYPPLTLLTTADERHVPSDDQSGMPVVCVVPWM